MLEVYYVTFYQYFIVVTLSGTPGVTQPTQEQDFFICLLLLPATTPPVPIAFYLSPCVNKTKALPQCK